VFLAWLACLFVQILWHLKIRIFLPRQLWAPMFPPEISFPFKTDHVNILPSHIVVSLKVFQRFLNCHVFKIILCTFWCYYRNKHLETWKIYRRPENTVIHVSIRFHSAVVLQVPVNESWHRTNVDAGGQKLLCSIWRAVEVLERPEFHKIHSTDIKA